MQVTLTVDANKSDDVRAAIRLLQSCLGETTASAAPVAVVSLVPAEAFNAEEPAPAEAFNAEEPAPAAVFTPDPSTVFAGNVAPAAPTAPDAAGSSPAPAPASVASAPPAVSGVEVDKNGLPWDMRIHAGTKVKNSDGSWRSKRGLNDGALVARVEAELRAAMGAPAATAGNVPAPPVPSAPATSAPPVPVAAGGPLPPVAEPAPPAPAPAPAAPAGVTTFPDVMRKISGLLAGASPRLTHQELQGILQSVGLASLPLLAARADLIPQVDAQIDATLLSRPAPAAPPLPPGTPVH